MRNPLASITSSQSLMQLVRFVFVGASAALVYFALTLVMFRLLPAWPEYAVSGVAYGLLVGPVYLVHHGFSFKSDRTHGHALPRYLAIQAGALACNVVLAGLIYHVWGLEQKVGSAIVTIFTSIASFALNKWWTFRQPQP